MRRRNLLVGGLGLALAVSLIWGYGQYQASRQLGIHEENQYQQAYKDMLGHMDNAENFLAKTMGSNSNSNNVFHLTGAWEESTAALNDLSNLPVDNLGSPNIAQLLNRTSDFSYTLAQRLAGGGDIKPEEQKALIDIHEATRKTSEDLGRLRDKAEFEDVAWTKARPSLWSTVTGWFGAKAEADSTDITQPTSVSQGLQLLDTQLQKLPPFQYQGKFNSVVSQSPKGLPPGDFTKEQAQANLNKFISQLGLNYNVQFKGDTKGTLPAYSFSLGGAQTWAEVSKQGGAVLAFNDMRDIGVKVLSTDQAKSKAQSYLSSLGYPAMALTSMEDHGSYLSLSYVVQQDGVRIYPDKVILHVAMDNGQLVGYNARAYLMFHTSRTIDKTKLSVAQARRYLKAGFQVSDTGLVLLAKDNYSEVLCYEFRGTVDSEEFLVYINAATGFEEQIYRVIKTPVGEYQQ